MKAFVIFPTICVFLLTMTLLSLGAQKKQRIVLLWSVMLTILFGGLMLWFSVDAFVFLYYLNFIGIVISIPCLTYWAMRLLSKILDRRINWIGVLGLGILSTVVTVGIAGFLIFISFLYNPMDPPINKQTIEKKETNTQTLIKHINHSFIDSRTYLLIELIRDRPPPNSRQFPLKCGQLSGSYLKNTLYRRIERKENVL